MITELAFEGLLLESDLARLGGLATSIVIHRDRGVVLVESSLASQEIVDASEALHPGRFVLMSSTASGQASVCLFEHFPGMELQNYSQFENRGICRLSTTDASTFVDLSVSGLIRGARYRLDVNEYGDLSEGCASTGDLLKTLCVFEADADGASVFVKEISNGGSLIGRALVIREVGKGADEDVICGIIARSAGSLTNTKTICSCSGKTLWQERGDREV